MKGGSAVDRVRAATRTFGAAVYISTTVFLSGALGACAGGAGPSPPDTSIRRWPEVVLRIEEFPSLPVCASSFNFLNFGVLRCRVVRGVRQGLLAPGRIVHLALFCPPLPESHVPRSAPEGTESLWWGDTLRLRVRPFVQPIAGRLTDGQLGVVDEFPDGPRFMAADPRGLVFDWSGRPGQRTVTRGIDDVGVQSSESRR